MEKIFFYESDIIFWSDTYSLKFYYFTIKKIGMSYKARHNLEKEKLLYWVTFGPNFERIDVIVKSIILECCS